MGPDASAQFPAWLTGRLPTAIDSAEQLREVAAILRRDPSIAAQNHAGGIERWLADGGDLRRHLGALVKRGGANDVPATRQRRQARDAAIRSAAEEGPGNQSERVRWLQEQLLRGGLPQLSVFKVDEPLPTSTAQLHRILTGQ